MKILSLNCWGGQTGQPLLDYIASKSEYDVLCLQEVFRGGADVPEEIAENLPAKRYNLFYEFCERLPEHMPYFHPVLGDYYGLCTFIRKGIEVQSVTAEWVHGSSPAIPLGNLGNQSRAILDTAVEHEGDILHILNFHGLWNGKGKTDAPERFAQSERIVEYLDSISDSVILIGDFNLEPSTKSFAMLKGKLPQDLIEKQGITSTRSSFYKKPQKYADYALLSDGLEYKHFSVDRVEVSDHLPLVLEV